MVRRSLNNEDEMCAFAEELAHALKPSNIVAFFGDLGAGKTTCIKHLIHTLNGTPKQEIVSPTFHYYSTYGNVHHFDLYRLKNAKEFLALGFDELLTNDTICCIEWSERIADILPDDAIYVQIEHQGQKRVINYGKYQVLKGNLSQVGA